MIRLHALLAVLAFALTACGGSGTSTLPRALGNIPTRQSDTTATSAGGAMALPGGGAMALPGGGAMALPGGGAMALPGGGAMAMPGSVNLTTLLAMFANLLPVCAVAQIIPHAAQCNGILNLLVPVVNNAGLTASNISGYHPSDLRAAYQIPGSGGVGQTVAVVVAGDDPTAEKDLAVYRAAFGLPPCASASACFKKVNQAGNSGSYPATIAGWAQETGIDVQMISAVCPACSILVVEANSTDLSDLAASVDTAVRLGATVVNNSYYAPEYDAQATDEQHFNHPGVAITVASGDMGYGPTFPASSRYVTAVGGTTLTSASLLGYTQTVWYGTGSGCSAYTPKPSWQHDACPNRTVADVAAIADPYSGVAVYNTTAPAGQVGWGVYGGTSVASPIVAAMYALAGNARSANGAPYLYSHAGAFAPVLTGTNGVCSALYLCTGGPGYTGPGGLGTPRGLSGL